MNNIIEINLRRVCELFYFILVSAYIEYEVKIYVNMSRDNMKFLGIEYFGTHF